MSLIIKVVNDNEIRKLINTPENIDDLKRMTSGLFGYKDYIFKYQDLDGDLITICSDLELNDAFEYSKINNLRSIKFHVEVDQKIESLSKEIADIDVSDEFPVKRGYLNKLTEDKTTKRIRTEHM